MTDEEKRRQDRKDAMALKLFDQWVCRLAPLVTPTARSWEADRYMKSDESVAEAAMRYALYDAEELLKKMEASESRGPGK